MALLFRSAGTLLLQAEVSFDYRMPYRSVRKKRGYFKNLDKAPKRDAKRDYYVRNSEKVKARGRSLYEVGPNEKKVAAAALYKLQPQKKIESVRAYYKAHKEEKKASVNAYYNAHRAEKNASDKAYYRANVSRLKAAAKGHYYANREQKLAASIKSYAAKPEVMKAMFQKYHTAHRNTRLRYFRKYHCCTKRVKVSKARYGLAQPSTLAIEKYYRCTQASLLADTDTKTKLTKQFKSQHLCVAAKLGKKCLESTVVRLAAKRLVGRSLQLRRKYAGLLLDSVQHIKSINKR